MLLLIVICIKCVSSQFFDFYSSFQVDEELEALLENGEGLYDEKQVVSLCRLMVRVETMEQKLMCLKLIQV